MSVMGLHWDAGVMCEVVWSKAGLLDKSILLLFVSNLGFMERKLFLYLIVNETYFIALHGS